MLGLSKTFIEVHHGIPQMPEQLCGSLTWVWTCGVSPAYLDRSLTRSLRTILLGIAFTVLTLLGKREWIGGLLVADAVLQLFDTGMAVVTHKGALAVLPAAIGIIDVWAGLFLMRAARVSRERGVGLTG